METLTLRGELGTAVLITVRGYEREGGAYPDDANWLRCSTEVEQGSFRGAVAASFETGDFTRFASELDQVISGSSAIAAFNTTEEALTLRVEVDHTGQATVAGRLRKLGAELSFVFNSDQAFLASARRDLKRVIAAFPERAAGG